MHHDRDRLADLQILAVRPADAHERIVAAAVADRVEARPVDVSPGVEHQFQLAWRVRGPAIESRGPSAVVLGIPAERGANGLARTGRPSVLTRWIDVAAG